MLLVYIPSCRETLIQDPGIVCLKSNCRGRRSISAYPKMAVQEMQKRRLLVLNLVSSQARRAIVQKQSVSMSASEADNGDLPYTCVQREKEKRCRFGIYVWGVPTWSIVNADEKNFCRKEILSLNGGTQGKPGPIEGSSLTYGGDW